MSTVDSVDYVNKRIYLSYETVGVPLDTMNVYRDVRALRVANESHRRFRPMIIAGGNIRKTETTFTLPFVQLLYGCRIVPYDFPHSLLVIRETFTDDGFVGVGCFNRTSVDASVDLDYQVAPVEVREVYTGGGSGLTLAQIEASTVIAKDATVKAVPNAVWGASSNNAASGTMGELLKKALSLPKWLALK